MTAALIFRTLERNTGQVGLKSNSCTTIEAVNPEIAALQQHQDPASEGAAATNKAIVLELAKQIASVGGNAQDALQSGSFPPGKIGDPTAAGNTCMFNFKLAIGYVMPSTNHILQVMTRMMLRAASSL